MTKLPVNQSGFVRDLINLVPNVAREAPLPVSSGSALANCLLEPAGQLVLISQERITLTGISPWVGWAREGRKRLVLATADVSHARHYVIQVDAGRDRPR
ncbi:MAG: hypothetical protein LC808_11775 [Actinobacteria bacterium]|nr:hypothetical protein [Actinomycetota bacterium]